jgi:ABC-type uncharacterized transport system substrate-binding protein
MIRRDFLAIVAAAIAPGSLWAQDRDRVRRIAVLLPYPDTDAESHAHLAAFRRTLGQRGWVEGQNLAIEYRWTGGDPSRLPQMAKELVALQPDVILERSTPVTAALLRETRSIPIVFVVVSDPVGDRLVSSMARPGGNVTGFTNVEASFAGKWLELLRELSPSTSRVLVTFGARTSAGGGRFYRPLVEQASALLGTTLVLNAVETAADIEQGIRNFSQEPNGGLLVLPDATTTTLRKVISSSVSQHPMPGVFPFRYFVQDGGLVSYGIDIAEQYRSAADYVDRILRGASPADLPVQNPTKFELVLNANTAKALGITIPLSVLSVADEVIE